jgi:hypothetical protein
MLFQYVFEGITVYDVRKAKCQYQQCIQYEALLIQYL